MKRVKNLCLLSSLFLMYTMTAYAYPPDNAAVLYYWALSMTPHDQALRDDITEYAMGERPLSEEVEQFVKRQGWLIHQLMAGSRIPHCDWGIDYSQGIGTRLPELNRLKYVAHLMAADARRLNQSGDAQQALERLLCLQRMAGHMSGEVTICHLVGLSIRKVSHQVLTDILSTTLIPEEMLVRLKSELGQMGPAREGLRKAFAREQKSIVRSFTREKWPQFLQETEAGLEQNEIVQRTLEKIESVDDAYLQKTRQYYLEFMAQLQAHLEKPFDQAHEGIEALVKRARQDLPQDPAALGTVLFLADYAKCLAVDTRARTRFNAMRVAVELYLIKLRSGQLPETLPPGLPQDCFCGRAFAYQKEKEGFSLHWQDSDPKRGVRGDIQFKVN